MHLKPTTLKFGVDLKKIEVSVHSGTKYFNNEILYVFPKIDTDNLLIIPTMQHAKIDLVNFGVDVEEEKDSLLENVISFIFLSLNLNEIESLIVCRVC